MLLTWPLLVQVLTIVDVSLQSAAPCIHIFAAVLALARSFKGFASFARLLGDASPGTESIMKEFNIVEVSLATGLFVAKICCISWPFAMPELQVHVSLGNGHPILSLN